MELTALAGNFGLQQRLAQRQEGRGLSHAYILSGPTGSGRHTLARRLCAAMVCVGTGQRPCGSCAQCKKAAAGIHPDILVVAGAGESKPISVDQIRALRADAHIRPNEGERKIYLLENADRMNASAQNAMLKLLEEGPKYAAFLLLCGNAGGMLQTVRSRCEELILSPVPVGECERWLAAQFPQKSAQEIRQTAMDCQGILGRAVARLGQPEEGAQERARLVNQLADALEKGTELELFEATLELDKGNKEQLPALLDQLEVELTGRMGRAAQRRRLFRAVELVKTLKNAAALNANPGQLAGWLCGGMFAKENLV
jgi:DNA polymerase-3 subunit delta'